MTTTTMSGAPAAPSAAKPWYKVLYIQVLIAIALGVLSAGSGRDRRRR